MKLDAITVTGRHRHSMGDIAGLAESMNTVGLLQPVVVTSDGALVAGARRLAAARSLGWDEVPAHVVETLDDAAALLRAERDENTCRKDFTPSEEYALYQALLELEKPKAKERQSEGARVGKVSTPSSRTVIRMVDDGRLNAAQKFPGETGPYLFDRADVEALAARQADEKDAS
ncbi:MAG: ParB/RepB/Spo0J family partition protein [Streptosporangiales bacterium]